VALAERQQAWLPAGAVGVVLFRSSLGQRVMRILDDSRALSPRLSRRSRTSVAMACLLVAGLGGLLGAAESLPATQPATDGDLIRVHGRVIDPDGKPVTGASVTVPNIGGWNNRFDCHPIARATLASTAGSRSPSKVEVSPYVEGTCSPDGTGNWTRAQVIASADGRGLGWRRWDRVAANGDLVVQLAKDDVPIEGRIVDQQGHPVPGVSVSSKAFTPSWTTRGASCRKRNVMTPSCGTRCWRPARASRSRRTATAGCREGIGSRPLVELRAAGGGIGYAKIAALTRPGPAVTEDVDEPIGSTEHFVTYGSKFEFVATPGISVAGKLQDGATASHWPASPCRASGSPGRSKDSTAGHPLLRDRRRRQLPPRWLPGRQAKSAPRGQPDHRRAQRRPAVPDARGRPAPRPRGSDHHLEMHRGVFITGKVTEKGTGKPVPARLTYTTYLANEHAAALPEFSRKKNRIDGYQSRFATKPDGTYRIVAVPGNIIVGAGVYLGGYRVGVGFDQIPAYQKPRGDRELYSSGMWREGTQVAREIQVPKDAAQANCDLEVDPGETVRVSIVMPDGKPASGPFQVRGNIHEMFGGPYFKVEPSAAFDAIAFGPDEERVIFVIDDARDLAALRPRAPPRQSSPSRCNRSPRSACACSTRRASRSPRLKLMIDAVGGRTARSATTDDQGWLTARVPVGVAYRASVWAGPYAGREVMPSFTPKPGEKIVGAEVKLKKQRFR